MSQDVLTVVDAWLAWVNQGDAENAAAVSTEDLQIIGPRGVARGHDDLRQWLQRAGFYARPLRWFVGEGGRVVVEQDALWRHPETGAERGRAVVASRFVVTQGRVAVYERHDRLADALATAGLDASHEVRGRRTPDVQAVGTAVVARAPTVTTPIGQVAFRVGVGLETLPDVPDEVREAGPSLLVARWAPVRGVTVRVLLIDYLEYELARLSAIPGLDPGELGDLAGAWAGLLDVTWEADSGPLTFHAVLPPGVEPLAAGGQDLVAFEVEAPGCQLVIGGPDDDALNQAIEDGLLPAHWAGHIAPDPFTQSEFGPRGEHGIRYVLPGGRAGDAAQIHCTVVWSATSDTAAWYAADVTVPYLWKVVDAALP